eukprot:c21195_g1_i1.p1 GENE.c21195_g1_i1~~c21195_g1_i1.p1  ORF type:complete len:363 (+),score=63.29 c21195_g1_i1:47-1090(+)
MDSPDVLLLVFSYLDAKTLCTCSEVCSLWKTVSNERVLWDRLCEMLWHDKVYVPQQFVDMRAQANPKQALRCSVLDATRDRITKEELCTMQWDFRFKQVAGTDWVAHDPYWNGEPPVKVRFHPDGGVTRRGDRFEVPNPLNITWRFTRRSPRSATRARHARDPQGTERRPRRDSSKYIVASINGRDVPTYVVSRYAANWGFIMQSCWTVYMSFPMPGPTECDALTDANIETEDLVQMQHLEMFAYNFGLALADSDSDEERVDDTIQPNRQNPPTNPEGAHDHGGRRREQRFGRFITFDEEEGRISFMVGDEEHEFIPIDVEDQDIDENDYGNDEDDENEDDENEADL